MRAFGHNVHGSEIWPISGEHTDSTLRGEGREKEWEKGKKVNYNNILNLPAPKISESNWMSLAYKGFTIRSLNMPFATIAEDSLFSFTFRKKDDHFLQLVDK